MSADIYEDETKQAQKQTQSCWFMGGIAHKLSFFDIQGKLVKGAA